MFGKIRQEQVVRWSWTAMIVTASYFALVYMPLRFEDVELNEKLKAEWYEVQSTNYRETPLSGIPLDQLGDIIEDLERSDRRLEENGPNLISRIRLNPDIEAQMKQSFQLIDYINEKLIRIESLSELAQQHQVKIPEEVLDSFPEHTSDMRRPELLWAQLEFSFQCLAYAAQSKAASIESIDFPEVRSSYAPGESAPYLDEIPVRVRLTGSIDNVRRFLTGLPLLPKELKELGLAESDSMKPSLFIGRILIRKTNPQELDTVQLDLTCWGLIYKNAKQT